MTAQLPPLPEYDAPPVSEVALSVEFLPLANWRSAHAGRYWSEISNEYPETEEFPPLPSQIEKFGAEFQELQTDQQRVRLIDPGVTRSWFIGRPPTRLIQVQRDRFIINWRKLADRDVYPRYEGDMRQRLERDWTRFKNFIESNGLGPTEVRQCEVVYVNTLLQGEGWSRFDEALELFSCLTGRGSDGFLPAPENLNISGTFSMPDERGRLHFSIQRIIRRTDSKEGVQLQLSARVRPDSSADADMLSSMDLGREWVVRAFTDLTTPKAHTLWKRTR